MHSWAHRFSKVSAWLGIVWQSTGRELVQVCTGSSSGVSLFIIIHKFHTTQVPPLKVILGPRWSPSSEQMVVLHKGLLACSLPADKRCVQHALTGIILSTEDNSLHIKWALRFRNYLTVSQIHTYIHKEMHTHTHTILHIHTALLVWNRYTQHTLGVTVH